MLADLPGLIEGAHEGAGLGDKFLGHAERCSVILHLIDGTQSGIVKAYKTIRGEVEAYGHGLGEKPQIVALNKIDSIPKAALAKKQASLEKASGRKWCCSPAYPAKASTGNFARACVKLIDKRRAKEKATPARAKSWAP